ADSGDQLDEVLPSLKRRHLLQDCLIEPQRQGLDVIATVLVINRKHAAQRDVSVRRAGLQLAFHLAVDDEQVDATLKADEQSNREQHQNRVADGATETDFLHETRLLDEQFQQVAAMRINAEKHKAVAAGIEQVGST